MRKFRAIDEARKRLFSGIGVPEKTEFIPDAFQTEAIEAVANGEDTLVVAPTGSGKTYIAFEAISAYLQLGTKSVYTTPLKALSNTKFNELQLRFGSTHQVGLLTGDRKIDVDADVVVATTEIYRNELYKSSERFSLVVLDEVHFIADYQRGAVWEESIILTPKDSSLLMLSASISNAQEIADWLFEVRGKKCRIIIETHRPVELRYGFFHPDYGVIPLRDEKGELLKEVTQFYGKRGTSGKGGGRGGRRSGRGQPRKGGRKGYRGPRRGKE